MPAFKETLRTCVVAGNLNPGIIQPPWLSQHKIVAEETTTWTLEVQMGAPTPVFMDEHLRWECKHDRLVVTSLDGKTNPGEAVAAVFRILIHTPVSAVGNNIVFAIEDDQKRQNLGNALQFDVLNNLKELNLEPGGYSTMITLGVNDALLNLKFDVSGSGVGAVHFNFHRPSAPVITTDPDNPVVRAAMRWHDDERAALNLLESMLENT